MFHGPHVCISEVPLAFLCLGFLFFFKEKKVAPDNSPCFPPTRTKPVILLALLRGDKLCQWKLLPTGEQFLFTYAMPTPCRNAGGPVAWLGYQENVTRYGFYPLPREQICCLL